MNFIFKTTQLTMILAGLGLAAPGSAEELITDDLVVDGSACIGMGCVSGEAFGGTELKIKQSSVRIVLEDTSAIGNPTTDWEIKANDVGSNGSEFFAIRNLDADTAPFRIWADAPGNGFVIANTGLSGSPNPAIGIGTRLPIANLHIDTAAAVPSIALERNGSGGLIPSRWQIQATSFEFNVREDLGTSARPLRIRGDAPENSLYISPVGDVGLGTDTPQGPLDIDTGADSATMFFTNDSGAWKFNHNVSTGRFNIVREGGNTPFKMEPTAANNLLRMGFGASDTVEVNGNLVISGNCTETNGACADYVFGPDHERLALPDLRTFIAENRHLPNVPSEADIRARGVNMAQFSGRMLEKIEELTLYTLEQDEVITAQQSEISALQRRLEALEAAILGE